MKLTDKFPATTMTRSGWPLYEQCSMAIGTVLDNKVTEAHEEVYEHTRHTAAEVFKHSEDFGDYTFHSSLVLDNPEVVEDEKNIIDLLGSLESARRLNVIGDVGVGKTTFLRHIIDVHVGLWAEFDVRSAIYISWADFNPTQEKAMEEIKRRFVSRLMPALGKTFGIERLNSIDDELFETNDLFFEQKLIAQRYVDEETRRNYITSCIDEARKAKSIELAYARINQLCAQDRNAILLAIDNIDHLPDSVINELFSFLVELQTNISCLMLVGMRDHTYNRGFSLYRDDKAVPSWHARLKPPNIKLLLRRRVHHFLEVPLSKTAAKTVVVGSGVLQMERDLAQVCHALLNAPFSTQETYDFICSYSNYSIRALFTILPEIIGSPGFIGKDKDLILDRSKLMIGIDECLIALGLGKHLMFYPHASPLFNPYSAGPDSNPLDKIVGARILQFLDKRVSPLPYKELKGRLVDWGYDKYAIDSQVLAMVNKDLVWTSTGAPERFDANVSTVSLSYRGHLYARKILRRTVFNYMMSFDVEAPDDSHPVFRHHVSEFKYELPAFGTFESKMDSHAVVHRVLGLAELIAEAERIEAVQLDKKRELKLFQTDVAPSAVCVGIVGGLEKFLLSVSTKQAEGGLPTRFLAPSSDAMKQVAAVKAAYANEFRSIFPN